MKSPDLDALGRQYREAKASITPHRRRQADAEVAHGRLLRRLGPDHPDVTAAHLAIRRAAADLEWCKSVVVAAGEAYKGISFDEANSRPTPARSGGR